MIQLLIQKFLLNLCILNDYSQVTNIRGYSYSRSSCQSSLMRSPTKVDTVKNFLLSYT